MDVHRGQNPPPLQKPFAFISKIYEGFVTPAKILMPSIKMRHFNHIFLHMFDEECIQLPPIHVSSKPNKRMNFEAFWEKRGILVSSMSYFYYFYYTWHFSHILIYEGVYRKFIFEPIAFKCWSHIFAHVDYLVICRAGYRNFENRGKGRGGVGWGLVTKESPPWLGATFQKIWKNQTP